MTLERDERRALAIALLSSLVLWHVPFGGFVLYPFKLLATWMHEISHAVLMVATGAGFDGMEVYRDGSGLASASFGLSSRAASAVIAAAGYMGAPLFGVAILLASKRSRGAQVALATLGAALLLSAALIITNRFGQLAIAAVGAATVAIAALLPRRGAYQVAQLVGAQACINAVLDIRVLFRPTLVVNGSEVGFSDAHNMALSTLGSDARPGVLLWASLWLAWSLALFYVALRRLRLAPEPTPPSPPHAP
jgi:hypothetical protein